MLRLKTQNHRVTDEYLALPEAQPVTLLQVSNENLPYACQCPLCGGIFEIPRGTIYRIEESDLEENSSDVFDEEKPEPISRTQESEHTGGFFGEPEQKSGKTGGPGGPAVPEFGEEM